MAPTGCTHHPRRWYIAVPCNLPFSYHRPPLWNNYSYTGPLTTAFEKAIALFKDEGLLDHRTVVDYVHETNTSDDDDNGAWMRTWRGMSDGERARVVHQAQRSLIIWQADAETPSGLVQWDAVPNEQKLGWGESRLKVTELV